jgi:hypothetical protein
MGYSGPRGGVAGVLHRAFRDAERTGGAPGERIADAAGERLTDRTKRRTPVLTGEARAAIRQKPTITIPIAEGHTVFETGAISRHARAEGIEYGTRPHVIEPKRAQAVETPLGPRARVLHPGTEGQHPFARAVAELEVELGRVADPIMRRWAAEVEAHIERHGRR